MTERLEALDERERRLDEVIAAILEARDAGETESQAAILDRYPEFARELAEFFGNEATLPAAGPLGRRRPCFGDDFEVVEVIGRGGMGVVYKAHQRSLDKVVAIKTIESALATPSEVARIHAEAQRAARLRHPNIVTVHQVGEHEGQHFFVMDYLDSGSLADVVRDGPLSSTESARHLMALAEAVHYAHQRQILHCDLKPANVLLDAEGHACVTDFGLARRLGEQGRCLPTSEAGGTATYMAPEQACGVLDSSVREELTTATDVYGLGGILYTLITGTTPFRAGALVETLRRVCDESPEPPSARAPGVDQDLEAICLKCLSKDKDARYGSAEALAADLARYRAREETVARSWNRRERLTGWSRRNPAVAGLLASVVGILVATVVTALFIANARKTAQLAEALQTNSFEAREQATTALLQLREWSSTTELAATDPGLLELLNRKDLDQLQRHLERICSGTFATCFVQGADGVITQRVRGEGRYLDDVTEEVLAWRDYFQGTKAHTGMSGPHTVHISRVYRGRSDALYKFAISAPIVDANGVFFGALSTSLTTDAAMGLVGTKDPRRDIILIAPKDAESSETDPRTQLDEHAILFHPAYRRGVPAVDAGDIGSVVPLAEWNHAEELTDPNLVWDPVAEYRDPVGAVLEEFQGRWIAGFAPVGHTGFVVVVQQRYEDALKLDPSLRRNLVAGNVLVIGLATGLVVVILRRSRPPTRAPG